MDMSRGGFVERAAGYCLIRGNRMNGGRPQASRLEPAPVRHAQPSSQGLRKELGTKSAVLKQTTPTAVMEAR